MRYRKDLYFDKMIYMSNDPKDNIIKNVVYFTYWEIKNDIIYGENVPEEVENEFMDGLILETINGLLA